METKDLENSVPEEQFSDNTENTKNNELADSQQDIKSGEIEKPEQPVEEDKKHLDGGENNTTEVEGEKNDLENISVEELNADEPEKNKSAAIQDSDEINENSDKAETTSLNSQEKEEEKVKAKKSEKEEKSSDEEKINDNKSQKSAKKIREKTEDSDIEKNEEEVPIDFTKLNKADLIKCLKEILDNKPVVEIKHEVDTIKSCFYKQHKIEIEKVKAKFIKDGGNIEDFKLQEDNLEIELKELLNRFKSLKADYNKLLEKDKDKNLEEKYKIIDEIKELINSKESINKTFNEFRDLQQRWRDIGLVPQQKVKDLWETYHHHVEMFYDYIKINKELRDIDLRKNLEEKIKLCERAEDLLLESSIIKAFEELQKLHNRWRETGPVPREFKEPTWERFKSATNIINKKHQEHFEELKKSQKNNLEAKTAICEKVEDINNSAIENHKEWEKKSQEVKELQKVWKTIGFAPKKHNNKIYQRFRNACDTFFNRKREFYSENKELQTNNLQLKLDLCEQAEALKDNTDWKKTSEDLIKLQKKWKEIGPVPKKQSDEVWKRFRGACDAFFNRKKDFFNNIDDKYDENLKAKEVLINEIKSFKIADNIDESINKLKEFQRRWTEIGFVPIKEKERIQAEYREAINKQFDALKIDDNKRAVLKFKNKIASLSTSPKFEQRIKNEREKFLNKLKTLENNIVLWENNIGFFANSKSAESVIDDVKKKIEKAKKEIKILEEKINIIDNLN